MKNALFIFLFISGLIQSAASQTTQRNALRRVFFEGVKQVIQIPFERLMFPGQPLHHTIKLGNSLDFYSSSSNSANNS
jgi:hypothetical protein